MEMNAEQKVEGGVKRRKSHTSNESITDEHSKLENTLEYYIRACPEEIHMVILSCLPSKTLSAYKRVCKHWNTTLTIQAFMVKHSRSYDEHSKLAFVTHRPTSGRLNNFIILSYELSDNKTSNIRTMTVPKTRNLSVTKNSLAAEMSTIIGHHGRLNDMSNICNELICLSVFYSTRVGLFNLKTQGFIQLPAVITNCACNIVSWYALGFEPISKVYKVLSIYGGFGESCKKAAILTLGSSKHWKPVEYKSLPCSVTLKPRYWITQNRFCFDGVIYWVDNKKIDDTSVLTVVAFNLNRELFTNYKLHTTPIEEYHTIKYYLTTLKGCPTLFIWKKESDEIQQLTLFKHKNPKASWNRRRFIAHDFPKNFPYGCLRTCVAGGSILLHDVNSIKHSRKSQERDNIKLSSYIWYDLENFAIE